MSLRNFTSFKMRAQYLEKAIGVDLSTITATLSDDESKVYGENLIGGVALPLGVAGPVKLLGDNVNGEFYIPLATTEGGLTASVSRGCKAITLSGGANVAVFEHGPDGPAPYRRDRGTVGTGDRVRSSSAVMDRTQQ